jgi:hypothetical protein
MANVGSGRGSMAAQTKIHQSGMKVRSPAAVDASMKCKGGSVNSESTRSSTAATPKTLGPRES